MWRDIFVLLSTDYLRYIGVNSFFCTSDTGIHIWKITEHGNYVIKANMDDHIRGI